MLTVVDKPRAPKEYNSLPGIMEADTAIRNVRDVLDKLVEDGSVACRSTLFAHGEVGAFLLHRHWEVQEGECMVERPGLHPSGSPALITSARRFPRSSSIAPTRFKVDRQRRELVALEFSSDQFAVDVWHALLAHPNFLEDIWQLIANSGLADQVGVATFMRAGVPVAEGEEMLEENWSRKSVLSAQTLVDDEQKVIVQTGWAFVSDSEEDRMSAGCIGYCMSVGGSHCNHHYARPEIEDAANLVTPPPLCELHD